MTRSPADDAYADDYTRLRVAVMQALSAADIHDVPPALRRRLDALDEVYSSLPPQGTDYGTGEVQRLVERVAEVFEPPGSAEASVSATLDRMRALRDDARALLARSGR